MKELALFFSLQKRLLKNQLHALRKQSRLKIAVVSFFAILFFAGLFALFYEGLRFFETYIPRDFFTLIIDYVFSIFYFALFWMLTFSSTIIAFSVFFHAKETEYLMTCPLSLSGIFFYKFFETFAFASWAVFFLGVPICFAYGIQQGVPLLFYPLLVLLFIPFILLPAVLGTLIAFLIILYLIKWKRWIFFIFFMGMIVGLLFLGISIASLRNEVPSFTTAWFMGVLDYLDFVHHPLLPSTWATKAMIAGGLQDYAEYLFQFALLFSSGLFLAGIAYLLSSLGYDAAYSKAHSHKTQKAIWYLRWLEKGLSHIVFLKSHQKIFLEKDIKTFLRDPLQWGQFAILLGLLLLYVLNLRTLRYDEKPLFWKHLIATLNLSSTALINCTFASRFIFPLLSLEGKRFWMLGVMPIRRQSVLLAKFLFALVTLCITSETLIFISSYMLRLPWDLIVLHAFTTFAVTLGVAGLSVGMGALYPNFREDSPAKIVSGFGGTFNLILNLFFVLSLVSLQSIPSYWVLRGGNSFYAMSGWFALSALLTTTACVLPLYLGNRAFARLEI